MEKIIEIPEGYKARIEGNMVIFEPKESEDERIRSKLIEFFAGYTTDEEWWGSITEKDILAWLEKQGEQKVPINDFKAKNWYVSEVDGKIHDMTYNPADKVEPKFKVGDWLINPRTSHIIHIKDVLICDNKGIYELENSSMSIENVENNFCLWSTQDAKDGDILVMTKDKAPFIFKGFLDKFHPDCPVAYGGIVRNGTFDVSSGDGWWDEGQICPATKEQRDLLFQKMEEAGYEWDAEKKKLKKIEQKPALSEEDNPYYDDICEILINLLHSETADINKDAIQKDLDWLKSLKERVQSRQDLHPRYIEGKGIYVPVIDVVLNMWDEPEEMTWDKAKDIALSKEQMFVVLYYKDEINALLEKHGGQKLEGWHWTSTQFSGATTAWYVLFYNSLVTYGARTFGRSVRAFSAYHPES